MDRKWLIGLFIGVVLIVAVFLFTWYSSDGHFVLQTIDYVVQNLASRSGFSPLLVRGLVILGTIPFFWAVAKYTHGLFWLHGVKPSLKLYRSPYGIVIVSYVGVFFISMYFASRDAYAYKWCADTPEGIRTFDAAGIDPVYGIPLKPCTFDQIVALRQRQKGFSGPQALQIENPRRFEFFDTITGKPRVWFYKSPDGGYEFYDRPGKHPGTGEDLRPVDREVMQELVRLQELARAQRTERELQAKQQEAEQIAAAQEREHQALLNRYINTGIVRRGGTRMATILILQEGQDSFSSVEGTLITSLSKRGIEAVSSFFKPPFVLEGRARKLLAGDWNEATQLGLSKRVDYVVLGSAAVAYSSSPQFEGLITANLQVELKCLNVVAQRVCGSQNVSTTGAGYTRAAALEKAVANAGPQLDSFARTL